MSGRAALLDPVQAEQVRLLYRGGIATVISGSLLATLFAWTQREVVPSRIFIIWLAAVWLVSLLRLIIVGFYTRAPAERKSTRAWLNWFRVGVFGSAAVWGAGGVLLFPPGQATYQVFLAFTLAVVTASSIISYAVDLVSVAGFVALTLMPFALRASFEAGSFSITMGLMMVLILGYAAIHARDMARTLLENIALQQQADVGKTMLQQKDIDLRLLTERLTALIEAIPDAILFKDGKGRWLITNSKAKDLFRLHGIRWRGKTDMELAADRPELEESYRAGVRGDEVAWQSGKLTLFQEQMSAEGSVPADYEVRKMPVFGHDGRRKALVVIGRDVTERRAAERELRIAAAAFDVQEGIVITDAAFVIQRVNRAFSQLTEYEAAEVVGRNIDLLRSNRHDPYFFAQMREKLDGEGYWQGEVWQRCKNGNVRPHWLTISGIMDTQGRGPTHYISTFSDISRYKDAEAEIYHLAYFDQLTSLPNRRLLLDRLQQALTASTRSRLFGAILFIDLDNFKTLNDTRGHDVGDMLLIEVAQRLQRCIRAEDTVARLGGDEFVVMLESLSEQAEQAASFADAVSHKILQSLNQPYLLGGYEHHTTPSIGVSLFSGERESLDDLLKHADAAMYQAKQSGRNAIRFFDPDMQVALENHIHLEQDLRQALQQRQLLLNYQMQVDEDRNILGAEVLLRWRHPERGVVPPAQFIPVAEDSGMIVPIGNWVLQMACAQLKRWEARPDTAKLYLSVNVSARQFRQHEFVQQVVQVLQQTQANPALLKLELTESLVLHNVEDTIQKMEQLRQIGIRFSMDDFGIGQSSLAQLKLLPLDQVKIDQSFVRDIASDPNDAAIVQTIIAMTGTLGLEVIAEGVETETQLEFLRNNGCRMFQGYLFSRPLVLAEFEQRLGTS